MPRNASIHGFRGLAAAMVFVLHLHLAIQTGGFSTRLAEESLAARALACGHRGVELFFMISGYLIAGSLVRHRSAATFFVQRLIRVYPAFLVPHLLIFTVGPWIGYARFAGLSLPQYLAYFASNLLMLPGYFDLPIANIVAWTLSLEMVFYLLAAGALGIVNGRQSRAAKVLLAGLWIGVAAVSLYRQPRAWFFVAGVAVYHANRKAGHLRPSHASRSIVATAALALMCGLFDWSLPAALACGLVGFWGIVGRRDLGCRLLETRPFQYLGDISYSLYLWHAVVLFPMKRLFGRSGALLPNETANIILFLAASILATWLASHLSYQLVERWFTLRFLRRSQPAEVLAIRQTRAVAAML